MIGVDLGEGFYGICEHGLLLKLEVEVLVGELVEFDVASLINRVLERKQEDRLALDHWFFLILTVSLVALLAPPTTGLLLLLSLLVALPLHSVIYVLPYAVHKLDRSRQGKLQFILVGSRRLGPILLIHVKEVLVESVESLLRVICQLLFLALFRLFNLVLYHRDLGSSYGALVQIEEVVFEP